MKGRSRDTAPWSRSQIFFSEGWQTKSRRKFCARHCVDVRQEKDAFEIKGGQTRVIDGGCSEENERQENARQGYAAQRCTLQIVQ